MCYSTELLHHKPIIGIQSHRRCQLLSQPPQGQFQGLHLSLSIKECTKTSLYVLDICVISLKMPQRFILIRRWINKDMGTVYWFKSFSCVELGMLGRRQHICTSYGARCTFRSPSRYLSRPVSCHSLMWQPSFAAYIFLHRHQSNSLRSISEVPGSRSWFSCPELRTLKTCRRVSIFIITSLSVCMTPHHDSTHTVPCCVKIHSGNWNI